jgi:hypothetical protein
MEDDRISSFWKLEPSRVFDHQDVELKLESCLTDISRNIGTLTCMIYKLDDNEFLLDPKQMHAGTHP